MKTRKSNTRRKRLWKESGPTRGPNAYEFDQQVLSLSKELKITDSEFIQLRDFIYQPSSLCGEPKIPGGEPAQQPDQGP